MRRLKLTDRRAPQGRCGAGALVWRQHESCPIAPSRSGVGVYTQSVVAHAHSLPAKRRVGAMAGVLQVVCCRQYAATRAPRGADGGELAKPGGTRFHVMSRRGGTGADRLRA
jgi:hypothetical protein